MSIEAMKQALEALEAIYRTGDTQAFDLCYAPNVIPALRQALAEAEMQEPVAWIVDGEIKVRLDMAGKLYYSETNVYTAPPKREWVGLTDEDIDLYAFDIGVTDNKAPAWLVTYARGIEAKLKEKNT
jgi:hypothetical protein